MQKFCGNVYRQIAQRPESQRAEPALCHQSCVGGSREKQPVALDEEARPLLGPEDDTEGGVPRTPDFTVAHLKTRLCQPSTVSVAFTTSEMTNVSVSQGY